MGPKAESTIRSQVTFAMVPTWLLERCHDSRAIHLYALLMRRATRRERRAWPEREELMAGLGASSRTLDRAIATLRTVGALTTELRHRPSDGAVIGVDYLLIQLDPQASHSATDGEKADGALEKPNETDSSQRHSATGGEMATAGDSATPDEKAPAAPRSISPESTPLFATGGDAIRRTRSTNQIQERRAESVAAPPPHSPPATDPEGADPVEAFRALWNALVQDPIKPCLTLTRRRRRWIRACLVDRPLDAWAPVIARVNASSFCRGEKGWVASFDWLVKAPDSAVKVLEGQYDDHVSAAELAAARQHLWQTTGGRCPHDPACLDRASCVRTLAGALRARKRAS